MRHSNILVSPEFKSKIKKLQLEIEERENRKIPLVDLTRRMDVLIPDNKLEINRWKRRGGNFELSF